MAAASLTGNLPHPATAFIGRERDLAAIKQKLPAARLLTLLGPGGCGKSRLALQLASDVCPQFADGVWWCDLAPVADPAHVFQAVAATLRVVESPQGSLLETLSGALRDRQILLVLDNCEHLLSACAALCRALLETCPRVQVVATSLQPLGVTDEKTWPVLPLACPDPAADLNAPVGDYDAVRLFCDRAQQALPSFQLTPHNSGLVAAICRRLDGSPLALELAAARVKLLTVEQLAQRLDNAFALLTRGQTDSLPRHQTLRATMDWSYQFLAAPEQALLRRLSVFAGSFTVEMVEAICGEGLADPGVLDVLTDLVEKSLVTPLARGLEAEPRFQMLETIRQYAREKLEATGESSAIRTRHLEWFAGFAQQVEPKLAGPATGAALAQLDANLDNLRLALQWVRTHRAVSQGLRLAGSLWMYWQSRGHLVEGRAWLEELLSLQAGLPDAPVLPLELSKAQYAAAALAFRQADYERAAALAEASLAAARQADNPARIGVPLSLLAILATEQGDYARAAAMQAEALELYRRLGDQGRISNTLINLGVVARRQGDYRRAVDHYSEALTLKRQLGDKAGAAMVLSNLGEIAILQGHLRHAAGLLEEGLLLYRELGSQAGMVAVLNNLGVLHRYQGQPAQAQANLEEALALCQAMGDKARLSQVWINLGDLARDASQAARAQTLYADALAQLPAAGDQTARALALHSLGLVAAAQEDDERARALFRESLQLYQATHFPLGMVESLEALARGLARAGYLESAARWLAAAEASRQALAVPVAPVDQAEHERARAALRQALGEAGFEAAWTAGRGLALEAAVSEALGAPANGGPAAGMPAPAILAAPQPQLRAFALGAARVEVAERALADADWTYAKARELFFYLLLHPTARKGQIGLDLWPDASPEQLRSAFHRTLHFLRRALGNAAWVLFEDEAYALNEALGYWFDVDAFGSHLTAAQQALRAAATPAARAQAVPHLEGALSLYRGDLLGDLAAGEWATLRREELRRRNLEAHLRLGELYFANAGYDQAAGVYRRLITIEPYLETAHRQLMRCLGRLGETGQAVHHYQGLRQRLLDELRTSPAPETTLLFERLRRGDDV